jgi:Na+/H+ antiporter NhaD/arsenite permease-like protein
VFFIFIVGNIGGSLTPVGDPPLLIGYLKGIPFFWYLTNLLHIWAFAIVLLLIMFYIIDKYFYEKVKQTVQDEIEQTGERIRIEGKWNLIPLFVIILSVMINEPKFLREIVMLLAAVISYKLTSSKIHYKNNFSFGPIKEVAILFLGIFLTMVPALVFVSENSLKFGLDKLGNVFWYSGTLTSFLDNAPTFLNFLTGAMSVHNLHVDNPAMVLEFAEKHSLFLRAISIASVFFGAITYVGNAPNFMIKSIAEHEGLKMAGFFEYMYKYSLVILIPVFVLIWFLFF